MGIIEWLKSQAGGLLVGSAVGAAVTKYGTKLVKDRIDGYAENIGKKVADQYIGSIDKRLEKMEKFLYEGKKDG